MVEVEKHLSKEELGILIREETDPRIKDRLNFIQHLYDGDEVPEATSKVGYGTTTGYNWLHAWNEDGVEGLVPNFGGGRPPKLGPEEEGRFIRRLVEDAPWTTAEIHELLAEEFDVEYSERHLRRKLESYGMRYAKPQPYDYRRPDDAEEILDERLQEGILDAFAERSFDLIPKRRCPGEDRSKSAGCGTELKKTVGQHQQVPVPTGTCGLSKLAVYQT